MQCPEMNCYLMDAGGEDDTAMVVELVQSTEGQIAIQIWLGRWVIRPSDFRGLLQVVGYADQTEQDTAWQMHENKVVRFLSILGRILSEEYHLPVHKEDGGIPLVAAIMTDDMDSDSPEARVDRIRKANRWTQRLSQTRGS